MSDTPETENLKCLSLIEVMDIPRERRTIALGLLQAIKERDEARDMVSKLTEQGLAMMDENRSLKREIKKLKNL